MSEEATIICARCSKETDEWGELYVNPETKDQNALECIFFCTECTDWLHENDGVTHTFDFASLMVILGQVGMPDLGPEGDEYFNGT